MVLRLSFISAISPPAIPGTPGGSPLGIPAGRRITTSGCSSEGSSVTQIRLILVKPYYKFQQEKLQESP